MNVFVLIYTLIQFISKLTHTGLELACIDGSLFAIVNFGLINIQYYTVSVRANQNTE